MAKIPTWNRTLSEVLNHPTKQIVKKSMRTGNTYTTDAIEQLELVCMGSPEGIDKDGQKSYRYSVYDMANDLEYSINCPNLVKVTGVKQLIFRNVVGGALSSGRGWYKADKVQLTAKK